MRLLKNKVVSNLFCDLTDKTFFKSPIYFMKNTIQSFFGQKKPEEQYPLVSIPYTEVRKINSKSVKGQEYELHVHLPFNYNSDNKRYPVVYLLDAQWDFPMVVSAFGQNYFDGFVPEIIIVGITWGGNKPDVNKLRFRDYIPTEDGKTGADGFIEFLKTELFPFVEHNYRADNSDKTLMCCSLGSVLAMYMLFKNPYLFRGFVLASPATSIMRKMFEQIDKLDFDNKNSLTVKILMTLGGVEYDRPQFEELTDYIKKIKVNWLHFSSKIIENTGHSGVKSQTLSSGLQYLFERPNITLKTELIQNYTGIYKNAKGDLFAISENDNRLVLLDNQSRKYDLIASSDTTFYSVTKFLSIVFDPQNSKSAILNTFEKTDNLTKS